MRGIAFSSPMVRKVNADAKTHTRRVIPASWSRCLDLDDPDDIAKAIPQCPYGKPGDHLWVQEPLRPVGHHHREDVTYDADGHFALRDAERVEWPWKVRYIASRYCPRWASRTTIELLDVRIERVQSITEADARAEGVGSCGPGGTCDCDSKRFADLWDEINGEREGCAWADNPPVWVLVFKRLRSQP